MYVRTENGVAVQYPYTARMLKEANPNTSFPKQMTDETLANYGVYPVVTADMPSVDHRTQNVSHADLPTLVDGVWTISWVISEKTAEEIEQHNAGTADYNRYRRNNLIAETDWWASSDLTMTAEQTAYRQALRDITTHANWPHLSEDDWPTKP
jgi:hypothetical protein